MQKNSIRFKIKFFTIKSVPIKIIAVPFLTSVLVTLVQNVHFNSTTNFWFIFYASTINSGLSIEFNTVQFGNVGKQLQRDYSDIINSSSTDYRLRRRGTTISYFSERWVLTAAHCTQGNDSEPANIQAIAGVNNLVTDGKLASIKFI